VYGTVSQRMPPPEPISAPAAAPRGSGCVDTVAWFKAEVHSHDGQLKAWLKGSFPSVRDVDDVVQESYLRIWRTRALHPIQSAKSFLFRVARNIALDVVRRERRSPVTDVGDLDALGYMESTARSDAATLDDRIELLTDIIAGLPERRRTIVILCKFRRMTADAVAQQLSLSRRTVENQLYRAVRDIENQLRARGVSHLYGDEQR
jgi:RNA polymerase sigma factor (sigma-70 family)